MTDGKLTHLLENHKEQRFQVDANYPSWTNYMYNVGTAKHKKMSVFVCAHNNWTENRASILFQTCCLCMTLERKRGENKKGRQTLERKFQNYVLGIQMAKISFSPFSTGYEYLLHCTQTFIASCCTRFLFLCQWLHLNVACHDQDMQPISLTPFFKKKNHCQCSIGHTIYKEFCSANFTIV